MRRFGHPLLVVLAAAGCGRIGFDPSIDALPADSTFDAPPEPWDGSFTLEPPVVVPELQLSDLTVECYVVPDGKRMYFANLGTPPSLGGHDFYTAERSDDAAPWTNVQHMIELSTVNAEGRLTTIDDLRGYYWTEKNGGEPNIYTVARQSSSVPFSDADAQPVLGLSSASSEYDPWLSRDGQRLYYMFGAASNDIYVADRVTDAQFTNQRPVPGVSSAMSEDNPTLSADELFIVFATDRGASPNVMDLYYARRSDRALPFDTPQPLPVINTTASKETEPCLTDSGELYFSSDRPAGSPLKIYRTRFIPL